jgi:hypothetical protein
MAMKYFDIPPGSALALWRQDSASWFWVSTVRNSAMAYRFLFCSAWF